jgi:DNA invertase Pin-like site-specific DNA recombinase
MSEEQNIRIVTRLSIRNDESQSHDTQQNLINQYLQNLVFNGNTSIERLEYNASAFNEFSTYNTNFFQILSNSNNTIFIFNSVDRFSRNLKVALNFLNICNTNNNQLHFIREKLIYKNKSNKRQIIDKIMDAEEESSVMSTRQKELNESRRRRRNDENSINTTSNKKRKIYIEKDYIIFTKILINKLANADDESISVKDIKKYMIAIINKCNFIDNYLKNQKIDHINNANISFNKEDDSDILNQTDDEIAELFYQLGISEFLSNGDEKPFYTKKILKECNFKIHLKPIKRDQTLSQIAKINGIEPSILLACNTNIHNLKENSKLLINTILNIPNNSNISNIKDEYCFFYGITSDKMNNITKLRNEFVVSMNDEDYRTYIENLIFNINNEHSNIEKISNNFQNMSVVSSSSSSSVFQTQSNINVEEKKKLLEIRKKKISLELQQLELEEEEQKMLTNSI